MPSDAQTSARTDRHTGRSPGGSAAVPALTRGGTDAGRPRAVTPLDTRDGEFGPGVRQQSGEYA